MFGTVKLLGTSPRPKNGRRSRDGGPRNRRTLPFRLSLLPSMLLALPLVSGCAPFRAQKSDLSLSQVSLANGVESAMVQCRFIGVGVLQDRLKNTLGISPGDVNALNADGSVDMNALVLATNLTALGQGDPAAGTFDDTTCSAVKFKATINVTIESCQVAMGNSAVVSRLFPKGMTDFSTVYLAFMGRAPTTTETQILNDMVSSTASSLSSSGQAAAVCAAVGSSLESMISI